LYLSSASFTKAQTDGAVHTDKVTLWEGKADKRKKGNSVTFGMKQVDIQVENLASRPLNLS
jgi:hypothetical protein